MLEKIDQALADIYKFNCELVEFDKTLTEMDIWMNGKAQVNNSTTISCISNYDNSF